MEYEIRLANFSSGTNVNGDQDTRKLDREAFEFIGKREQHFRDGEKRRKTKTSRGGGEKEKWKEKQRLGEMKRG